MSILKDSAKPAFIGLLIFFLLTLLTQFLSYQRYLLNKVEEEQRTMTVATSAKSHLLGALNYSLAATKTLAFIVERYGVPKDFDVVSQCLLESNKFIDAMELVEGGTITHVYPLEGNEAAIGYNILETPALRKEALKAIDKKELFFAGPFELKQGGLAVVGRQPIFIEHKFWGFSVVLIKFSTLIQASGINDDVKANYDFQLSKRNPETQQEEFFLPRVDKTFNKGQFVSVPVPHGEWILYVKAKRGKTIWDVLPNIIFGIFFSVTGGFFAWFIAGQPQKLRKQVEEKTFLLGETQKRYRVIVENSLQALFLSKPDGTILEANRAACVLFGYTEDEFRKIGREHIIEENSFEELKKENGSIQGELRGIRKNGERFVCEYSSVLFKDTNGEKFASTMVADISERKQNEKQIRQLLDQNIESSLLMERAQKLAHLGNWQWEVLTNVVYWSNELYSIYGLAREIFPPTMEGYFARLHADDREHLQRIIKDALKLTTPVTFEERIVRPSGEVRYLKSWVLSKFNAEGIVVKMIGACLDITEVKEAEKKQVLIEQRFKSLVQEGSDLISILDADGCYVYVSPACVSILGRSVEDFFSKNAFDFIHEADRDEVRHHFDLLESQKKIKIPPFRFLDGHNKYRWLESTATNMKSDPAVGGFVINSSDITERVNYITAIELQNKKLREIAWTQSHVVRAPLARLMGLVNLLTLKNIDLTDVAHREVLEHIRIASIELDNIVREIVRKTESIDIPKEQ